MAVPVTPTAGPDSPAPREGPREQKRHPVYKRLAGAFPARFDPGLAKLRGASVTMSGALLSYGTALLLDHFDRLSLNFVVLAVVLALSLGRVQQSARPRQRLVAGAVLPAVAVAASEVGRLVIEHATIGDAVFVGAICAAIWVRRFGPGLARVGTLATLPFVANLITPAAGTPGGSGTWWAAVVAVVAVFWASVCLVAAERTGFVPVPTPPRTSPAAERTARRAGLPASTRMALQMSGALTASFVVGRTVYPTHWTWIVLTAYIVGSAAQGRGAVAHKGAMRVLGASAGTAAATVLAGAFPQGDAWSVVAIFAVLTVALWLRQVNYAYWACGMTASLALLDGYFGEQGTGLLVTRLEEILIGAAIAITASWLILPVRSADVVRRYLAAALKALSQFLAAARDQQSQLTVYEAQFRHAVDQLEQVTKPLRAQRLLPSAWTSGHDHSGVVQALGRCSAPLRTLTRCAVSDPASFRRTEVTRLTTALQADIAALRRALAAGGDPDTPANAHRVHEARGGTTALPEPEAALLELAAAVTALGDALAPSLPLASPQPAQALASEQHDRRWAATERILAFVNRSHGTDYHLVRRLDGEQSSAYLIRGPNCRDAVLKWSERRDRAGQILRAGPIVAAARTSGWPSPGWLAAGTTPGGYPYQVQEHATGTHPRRVTEHLARSAVAVIASQAGQGPDTGQDWSERDFHVVFDDPALLTKISASGPGGVTFTDVMRCLVTPFRATRLPGNNLVHGAFLPGNILVTGDRISALVGVAGIGRGNRFHDVATLLVDCALRDGEAAARDVLLAYAHCDAGPGELEISVAARLVTLLAFEINHHPDKADSVICRAAQLLNSLCSARSLPGT